MDNLENYYNEQPTSTKFSGMGIASFIIAMTTIFIYICFFAIVYSIMEKYIGKALTPKELSSSDMAKLSAMGLIFIGGVIANLTGIGLGIAGVVQKFRKKIFGILGLIFNSLQFLSILGLIIIALSSNPQLQF